MPWLPWGGILGTKNWSTKPVRWQLQRNLPRSHLDAPPTLGLFLLRPAECYLCREVFLQALTFRGWWHVSPVRCKVLVKYPWKPHTVPGISNTHVCSWILWDCPAGFLELGAPPSVMEPTSNLWTGRCHPVLEALNFLWTSAGCVHLSSPLLRSWLSLKTLQQRNLFSLGPYFCLWLPQFNGIGTDNDGKGNKRPERQL